MKNNSPEPEINIVHVWSSRATRTPVVTIAAKSIDYRYYENSLIYAVVTPYDSDSRVTVWSDEGYPRWADVAVQEIPVC